MTYMDTLLLILVATATGFTFATVWLDKSARKLHIVLSCQLAAQINSVQKKRMARMETRHRSRLLEDTVQTSTVAVQVVHRSIAETTFKLVDYFPTSDRFRHNTRRIKTTHDTTSKYVYQTVKTTNRAVHALTDMLLTRKEQRDRKNQP